MVAGIQTHDIQKRSYMIWEQKGRPNGQALEHWLQAERELSEENGGLAAKPAAARKPAAPRKRRTKKAATAT